MLTFIVLLTVLDDVDGDGRHNNKAVIAIATKMPKTEFLTHDRLIWDFSMFINGPIEKYCVCVLGGFGGRVGALGCGFSFGASCSFDFSEPLELISLDSLSMCGTFGRTTSSSVTFGSATLSSQSSAVGSGSLSDKI